MLSLSRSVTRTRTSAPIVHSPYQALAGSRINIRKGEVSMFAGPPGTFKSTLAVNMALRSGEPTVYLSADTHQDTMSLRLISMITGIPQDQAEELMLTEPEWASQVLRDADHIRWCFESAPSLRDIELQVEAHRELLGIDPGMIVVDNLIDCTFESGDEYSSLRSLLRELKWWARDTGAAVVVLHHTSESVPGNPCPPRSALHGKVAQTPAMIVTLAFDEAGFLGLCPVKNRYGPASPSGSTPTWLRCDPNTMTIGDLE